MIFSFVHFLRFFSGGGRLLLLLCCCLVALLKLSQKETAFTFYMQAILFFSFALSLWPIDNVWSYASISWQWHNNTRKIHLQRSNFLCVWTRVYCSSCACYCLRSHCFSSEEKTPTWRMFDPHFPLHSNIEFNETKTSFPQRKCIKLSKIISNAG